MSNVEQVIEKAKTAIKNRNVEDAVKYDSILNQYLKTGLNNVYNQTEFHKNLHDFIFKYRLKYYFVEIALLILMLLMVGLTVSTETAGWDMVMYGATSLYLFYKLFKHFLRHQTGMKMTKNQEDAIITEKLNHDHVLNKLSKITHYQMETFSDMAELYQEYEKNNNFSNLFSGLGQKPDYDSDTDQT